MSGARKIRHPEDDLQRQQIDLLKVLKAQGRVHFFAVPNGGKRSKAEAAIMQGLGVVAGVPDLVLMWNRTPSGAARLYPGRVGFIENKVGRNDLTDMQRDWRTTIFDQGHAYAICRSMDDFLNALVEFQIMAAHETGKVR